MQKQARHLKIDPNSNQFQELIRCVWMPRLIQKIHSQSSSTLIHNNNNYNNNHLLLCNSVPLLQQEQDNDDVVLLPRYSPSSMSSSSSSSFTSAVNSEQMRFQSGNYDMETLFTVMGGGCNDQNQWLDTDEFGYGSLWNMELDDEFSQFQER